MIGTSLQAVTFYWPGFAFLYSFWHQTTSAGFVLFLLFMTLNLQLLQETAAGTFGFNHVYTFNQTFFS